MPTIPLDLNRTAAELAAKLGRHGIATDIYAGRPDLVYGTETQPRQARKIIEQEETP